MRGSNSRGPKPISKSHRLSSKRCPKFLFNFGPCYTLEELKPFLPALILTMIGMPPTAHSITLNDALREALRSHPLLAAAQNRIESAAGKMLQAGLRPNPVLIVQSEDFRVWESPGHRYWQDADHFLYLQQTFETAAKRARRVDVALANQRRAEIELTLQKQMIAARVRAAYWDAQGARQREAVLLQSLARYSEITEFHRNQVKEGAMAEADLLRVQLEEQKIVLAANSSKIDAERQSIRLQREMGRGAIEEITLESPLTEAPASFAGLTVFAALEQRAEAQLARQIIAVAGAQVGLERALATPNVEGVAGYKRSHEFDTVLWGVQVQLPFFNRNQGNIASASAEDRLARNALIATEALLKAEYEGALRDVQLRAAQIETLVQPIRQRALETANLAQAAYRLGGADLLRLLDAQRQVLEAEQMYLDAVLGLRQAEAALQSATGLIQ